MAKYRCAVLLFSFAVGASSGSIDIPAGMSPQEKASFWGIMHYSNCMRPTVARLRQEFKGRECFGASVELSRDLARVTDCGTELRRAAHLLAIRKHFREYDPELRGLSSTEKEAKIAFDLRDEQGVLILKCPTM
jgi:hypothetical protein